MPRSSGILLHPTSLPGPHGIGDLGPAAFRFADWLSAAGQKLWQVLPLGPTGYGESPYQLFSAFAGNPLLLSLDLLGIHEPAPPFPATHVDFERVIPWKTAMLRRAFEAFHPDDEFAAFHRQHAAWLEPFVHFMALKHAHGGTSWTEWDPRLAPDPREKQYHRFLQFHFFRQWNALREHCTRLGIRFLGDVPIYVSHDSADAWSHPDLFRFDAVSGVPPDYFSATGQLWGNPLYRWDRMAGDGYAWWIDRMRATLSRFDVVRMDHFRGFEAFWEVPAGETTAVRGHWVQGPGADLFRALTAALGPLPILAENLGVITPEVEAIREQFAFPGMAVLQFAFGNDPQAPTFLPHNYVRNLFAYTGTHDNDTVVGWWQSKGGDSTRTPADVQAEKARARAYLDTDGNEIHWKMIRTILASVADSVIFPLQDVLGLGTEARMNTPSTPSGNWRWRVTGEALTPSCAGRLSTLTALYGR